MYICSRKECDKNMKTKEVTDYLDSVFHPEYQEDYDNSGFLLGDRGGEYRGSLVALDLTPAVAEEAVELGLNLIVTHHPFIFGGVKRLTDATETGRLVMTLIRNGIAVYAAHTNLDNLPWGVSGVLAGKLGLKDCRCLKQSAVDKFNVDRLIRSGNNDVSTHQPINVSTEIGAGMVGNLEEPMEVEAFLQKVKGLLGIPFIRTSPLIAHHSSPVTVRRVTLCGGSGAEFIGDAIAAGADLYLTADLKYHDFQRAEGRIVLADAGHYETEQFAKEIISRTISEKFSNFAVCISERQRSLVQYI